VVSGGGCGVDDGGEVFGQALAAESGGGGERGGVGRADTGVQEPALADGVPVSAASESTAIRKAAPAGRSGLAGCGAGRSGTETRSMHC